MAKDQLLLIANKGNHHQIVFGPSSAMLCAFKKKELISSGNWKGWTLKLRTISGYKNVPIVGQKLLTFEQKIKLLKP